MDRGNTKQEILDAALELFSVQGFEATSIAQIAGAVGIRKASLYSHFENKQAILNFQRPKTPPIVTGTHKLFFCVPNHHSLPVLGQGVFLPSHILFPVAFGFHRFFLFLFLCFCLGK